MTTNVLGLVAVLTGIITAWLVGIAINLVSEQISTMAPRWATISLHAAARRLPASARDRYAEEWAADLDVIDGPVARLWFACRVWISARSLRREWLRAQPSAIATLDLRRRRLVSVTVKVEDVDAAEAVLLGLGHRPTRFDLSVGQPDSPTVDRIQLDFTHGVTKTAVLNDLHSKGIEVWGWGELVPWDRATGVEPECSRAEPPDDWFFGR